jgi:hypothetical protein
MHHVITASTSNPLNTFVENVVRPNVEEALTHPNHVRQAFNACASIEALANLTRLR